MDDMTAAGQPARRSTTAREAVFFLPDAAADAVLALEDGRVFRGHSVGAPGRATGEVVFTTGMTGYQEVLTDPSYAGQIVTFTYPLIGNVGVNPVDAEAPVPRCQGVILRRLSRRASNHRATGTLQQWLHREGLVAVAGIDTRALTRHIRSAGALRGVLEASDAAPGEEAHTALDLARLVEEARALPSMQGRDLTGAAACGGLARCTGTGAARRLESLEPDGAGDPFAGGEGPRVLVLDFGVKHGILERLVATGARVVVAPGRTTVATVRALRPDGIVLSNGPGDPAAVTHGIATVRALLGHWPLLGICLGHQLLALALGLTTTKLKFGHHGQNHPVREAATGRVLVTSQNHGFTVEPPPASRADGLVVTHTSLYDGTVEGIAVESLDARSIQFHPEANPGPHDARPVLERFVRELRRPSPATATGSSSGRSAATAAPACATSVAAPVEAPTCRRAVISDAS